MLRIWAIVLLISVLMQSFSSQVIYTEFLLNRNFIANVLCVNKDVKMNHCQGKCHLKKQLQQDTERQEKNNQQLKSSFEVLFSQVNEKIVFTNFPVKTFQSKINYPVKVLSGFTNGIFHPPSC